MGYRFKQITFRQDRDRQKSIRGRGRLAVGTGKESIEKTQPKKSKKDNECKPIEYL